MYTSFIGKKFLTAWNAREGKSLTARQFFDEIMFRDFFDDDTHLMQVLNSKFVNPSVKGTNKEKAHMLHDQISQALVENRADASFFVGYAAAEVNAKTSGQVTSMKLQLEEDEIYSSWIGQALSLGIDKGFCLLAEYEEILWGVFEGWKVYRSFLKQSPNIKGRQIETWNGQWIAFWLNKSDSDEFSPTYDEKTNPETKHKYWALNTLSWTKLLLAFSKKYPNKVLLVSAYNLSKSNMTLGFLNLFLPEVYRLYQLRDKVFINKEESILTRKEIEDLEPFFTFKDAAEFGAIGLRALEPDKLREYLPQRDPKKNKDFNLTKEANHKQFQIFKIWIYAMLNRQELLDLADKLAKILFEFEKTGGGRGKTVDSRLSEQIRDSTTIRQFVENMETLLSKLHESQNNSLETIETIQASVREAYLNVSPDQFPLFVALVRFGHTSLKHKAKSN